MDNEQAPKSRRRAYIDRAQKLVDKLRVAFEKSGNDAYERLMELAAREVQFQEGVFTLRESVERQAMSGELHMAYALEGEAGALNKIMEGTGIVFIREEGKFVPDKKASKLAKKDRRGDDIYIKEKWAAMIEAVGQEVQETLIPVIMVPMEERPAKLAVLWKRMDVALGTKHDAAIDSVERAAASINPNYTSRESGENRDRRDWGRG